VVAQVPKCEGPGVRGLEGVRVSRHRFGHFVAP